MINNELLSFVKERLSQGETKDQVTQMLVANGGWDDKDVDEAFDAIEMSGTSLPSLLNTLEKEKEESQEPAIQSVIQQEAKDTLMRAETPISEITATPIPDIKKIQFAEQIPVPILTTATIQSTPVPFTAPVSAMPIQSISAVIPPETDSVTPLAMEIPEVPPQDIPDVTFFSNLNTATPGALSSQLNNTPVSPIAPVATPSFSPAQVSPITPTPIVSVVSTPEPFTPAPSDDVKIDETLQNLRTRFMQGRVISPSSVSSPVHKVEVVSPRTTPFVPGLKGLSSHVQSGMIPTERPANISTAPAFQTSKFVSRETQPISVLSLGQKPSAPVPFLGQKPPLIQTTQMPLEKARGRKLLGFFMFMSGMLLGAIAMHAYTNEYLKVLSTWMNTLV